jgi:hypothetical protein
MKRSSVTGLILGVCGTAILMAATRGPTYRHDVLPILEKNCLACHSPGKVGPMSFATYEDARPWARQMKAVVIRKKMPPGIVERHYGLLGDDGTLLQAEIDAIVEWVDAGAPEGAVQDSSKPRP